MARSQRSQQIQAKRQLARKARSLSMRKAARQRRDLGVNDLGSFAPRVPSLENIDRYNMKQLDSYIKQSEQYRARDNQVVRLGSPTNYELISGKRYQQFDQQQRLRARQARDAFASVEDYMIPSKGQTIGQRRKDLTPERKRHMSDNVGTMATPKTPDQITSLDALEQLEANLRAYNAGGEHQIVRDKAMESLEQMDSYFSAYGAADIMENIRNLSDDQFYALWNINDFANNAANIYENLKNLDDDVMSADKATMTRMTVEQDASEIRGLIEGVKQISGTGRRF